MTSYEHIKAWRRRTRERIVAAMGGACCVCGYNRCLRVLCAHHLDPSEKDFNVGQAKANPMSWSKIVDELRKCVLLCHNCHGEVHEGMVELPVSAPRFDESYAAYEPRPKLVRPVKSRTKLIRPSPEELVVLLENYSACAVGRMYDVSSAAVAKWCKKHGIQTKPRGYWAKVK